MKPLHAIAIGVFGVIAGYFVALGLLFLLACLLPFLFEVKLESVLSEPDGLLAFIVVVSLLCGPLAVYLCVISPRVFRWLRGRSRDRHRRCTGCGYDLFFCRSTKCPECGKPIPIAQRQRLAQLESSHA